MDIVEQIAFILALMIIAGVCLFFPRKVQAFYARFARPQSLRTVIQSAEYLFLVRAVGILALGGGIALLWASVASGN